MSESVAFPKRFLGLRWLFGRWALPVQSSCIEVSSDGEAITACSANGIAAVSVTQGWIGPKFRQLIPARLASRIHKQASGLHVGIHGAAVCDDEGASYELPPVVTRAPLVRKALGRAIELRGEFRTATFNITELRRTLRAIQVAGGVHEVELSICGETDPLVFRANSDGIKCVACLMPIAHESASAGECMGAFEQAEGGESWWNA